MALMIPNGYGVVTIHWTYNTLTRPMSATIGVRDVMGTNDPNLISNAYRTNLAAIGAPCNASNMTTAWTFTSVTCLLRTSTGFLVTGGNLTPINGSGTPPTGDIPVYTPLVVSKLTAFAGRSFRGRMYVPFTLPGENSVDAGGSIATTPLGIQQAAWTQFLTVANGSNYTPFLLHTDIGPSTPTPNAIASLLCRPVTGIQRRRRSRGA